MGQVVMLELAAQLKELQHFVYASSSSVYGGNTKCPFPSTIRSSSPTLSMPPPNARTN